VAGTGHPLSIAEVLLAYWGFAKQHYRKNGEPTNELNNIRYALRPLKQLFGHTAIQEFGPKSLKAIQEKMIASGMSRGVINQRIGIIKRVFRWAV
jgi:hypothetical protein